MKAPLTSSNASRPLARAIKSTQYIHSSNGKWMLLHKLIYRRHISRLLSPAGRRAGVAEAFNLSLSADSYTTPARPIRRPTLPHPSPPQPRCGRASCSVGRCRRIVHPSSTLMLNPSREQPPNTAESRNARVRRIQPSCTIDEILRHDGEKDWTGPEPRGETHQATAQPRTRSAILWIRNYATL